MALVVKNWPASAGDARDVSSIPGSGRSPGVGNGKPSPVFLPGKFHGQRRLVGYSPWGHRELDMTEWLSANKNTQWNILQPQEMIWRREWQPTPVSLPGESHGQRSLAGCSPWDHKESDTTERLTLLLQGMRVFCHLWQHRGPWAHLLNKVSQTEREVLHDIP